VIAGFCANDSQSQRVSAPVEKRKSSTKATEHENNFFFDLQSARQRQWKGDCQVQNRTNMDKIFHKKSCRF